MISNRITKMIVSLLINLLLFSVVTIGAATTTNSGVVTTYGGVTATYSGYSGVTTNISSQDPGEISKGADENVTIAVQTTIPVATLSEKATETAKVPSTPAEKASGFEVVFTVITICAISIFKLRRR